MNREHSYKAYSFGGDAAMTENALVRVIAIGDRHVRTQSIDVKPTNLGKAMSFS